MVITITAWGDYLRRQDWRDGGDRLTPRTGTKCLAKQRQTVEEGLNLLSVALRAEDQPMVEARR